jgi:hypothetical protein
VISPRGADAIRKVVGYALAVVLTVLLFRVLGRTANGRQRAADPELVVLVVLASAAILWVRAAKRIRRGAPPSDDPEGDAGPPPP